MSAAPLLVLGFGGVVVLLLDLLLEPGPGDRGGRRLLQGAALACLAAALAALRWPAPLASYGGALVRDPWGDDLAAIAVAAGAAAVLLRGRDWGGRWGAFLALVLWAAAGMVLLAQAGSLLTLFVGVEVLSLALYALAAFDVEEPLSAEAGFKYFVLGGVASGLLLFGAALWLASGQGAVGGPAAAVGGPLAWRLGGATGGGGAGLLADAGQLLVVGALGFKLGLVPLHVWLPDVYEGAPTPVTAFMSAGTKAAALAAFGRVVAPAAAPAVAVLALLSMFAGYLLAAAQAGLKRLLAYSSVAHAGTVALAVLLPPAWWRVAVLYAAAYGAASVGAFGVTSDVEAALAGAAGGPSPDGSGPSPAAADGGAGRRTRIRRVDLAGLAGLVRRQPVLGALTALFVLALASVPPLGVFAGKLYLLGGLLAAGRPVLAVLVAGATVASLYPYFRVLALLVASDAGAAGEGEGAGARWRLRPGTAVVVGLAAAAVALVGLLPGLVL